MSGGKARTNSGGGRELTNRSATAPGAGNVEMGRARWGGSGGRKGGRLRLGPRERRAEGTATRAGDSVRPPRHGAGCGTLVAPAVSRGTQRRIRWGSAPGLDGDGQSTRD